MCGERDRHWVESNEAILAENYRWFEPYGFTLGPDVLGFIERELGGSAPVDLGLRGGETIRLGPEQRWEVLALPGHTLGHIGLWDAAERTAIIIDAVLGRGVCDRAGQLLIPPRIYDLPGYRGTIETVRALRPELLLTAHYPVMDRAAGDRVPRRVDGLLRRRPAHRARRRGPGTAEPARRGGGDRRGLRALPRVHAGADGDRPQRARAPSSCPRTTHKTAPGGSAARQSTSR